MSAGTPTPFEEIRALVHQMLDGLDPKGPISATVEFQVNPEHEREFIGKTDELTEATRTLPGLTLFTYHKVTPIEKGRNDDYGYIIYEEWESVEKFRAQWDSEHLKNYQNSVTTLLAAPPAPDFLNFYYGSEDIAEAPVPRTGICDCWDTTGQNVSCSGSGQDGEVQAGVEIPNPRFTDNADGTITDLLTGLIWLQDADHFGEVNWQQSLVNAKQLCSGQKELMDDSAPGDWRLPNIRELRGLVDYNSVNPMIQQGHPFKNVHSSIYWSSTTLLPAPFLAWVATTAIGPGVFDIKGNANRMWPVRGQTKGPAPLQQTGQTICFDASGNSVPCEGTGQDGDLREGIAPPIPRFIDNGDGSVMDKFTGLVWLKNANPFGPLSWKDGLEACHSLSSGKHQLSDGSNPGDWRMPNVLELESLVDYGRVAPSLPASHPFSNVVPTSYWASTTVSSAPTQAMFVILGVGPSIFEHKEHPFLIWPVRDHLSK